jgi:hypothetical protein
MRSRRLLRNYGKDPRNENGAAPIVPDREVTMRIAAMSERDVMLVTSPFRLCKASGALCRALITE